VSRTNRSLFGWVLAVLLVPSALSAAPLLSIQPPVTDVHVGDVFVLDVSITGAVDLFAFDVEVHFDQAIVQALNLIPGTFLGSSPGVDVDFFSDFIDNGAGEASGAQSRFAPFPGVSGDGVLYSIRFQAVGVGTTDVDFDIDCDALDPFCSQLRDSNDVPTAFDTAAGIVNVAPSVPEPATALVVGIGLIGALSRRRTR